MDIQSERIYIDDDEGFIATINGNNLLYFPLRKLVLRLSQEGIQVLKGNINTSEQTRLVQKIGQILKTKKKVIIPETSLDQPPRNVLGLALTTACNLRCTYCHANGGETSKFISTNLINDAIDYVFTFCRDREMTFHLIFTGSGEPTIYWHGLTKVLNG